MKRWAKQRAIPKQTVIGLETQMDFLMDLLTVIPTLMVTEKDLQKDLLMDLRSVTPKAILMPKVIGKETLMVIPMAKHWVIQNCQ